MRIFSFMAVFLLLTSAACAGRMPSPKTAHGLTASYFKAYGKKYKTSVFGENKISKIEVNHIRQLSLHWAEVETFIQFDNGHMARVLVTTKNVPPFGWKVSSWEINGLK